MGTLSPTLGVLLALAACFTPSAAYYYLPGIGINPHKPGESVPIKVNSLFSNDGIVSYDFYSLAFCAPDAKTLREKSKDESLGEIIWGDRIEPSYYFARVMVNETCKVLCPKPSKISMKQLRDFDTRINNGYRGSLVLENLPLINQPGLDNDVSCMRGFKLSDTSPRGFALGVGRQCLGDKTHINNHLDLYIDATKMKDGRYIIVGFSGKAYSINHEHAQACNRNFVRPVPSEPVTTDLAPGQTSKEIIWTYSVTWRESQITWGHRWDAYLNLSYSNTNAKVHWLSIINSLLLILCMGGIVAMIILRTLHMDFNRYNNKDDADERQEEVGWKLVHGSVFRTPSNASLFAVFIGTGVQLLGMFVLSLFFALLGFLSPAKRGGLLTTAILLFVLMALGNGFVTGITLKMFHKGKWKTVFLSGVLYPSVLFLMWLSTELYVWTTRPGANTAPIISVLSLMGLWFGISIPLVVIGASFGLRGPLIEPVCRVDSMARKIPPQRWYLQDWFLILVPGFFPFIAAFIELNYILTSMWQGMVYYVFGFLALTFVAVFITAAEVTIVLVYFLLVFEDYRWWWKSIAIPGGMGIYFFLNSIRYFNNALRVKTWLATVIYFETMFAISLSIYIMVGTIGALVSFAFVRIIYSHIKVD